MEFYTRKTALRIEAEGYRLAGYAEAAPLALEGLVILLFPCISCRFASLQHAITEKTVQLSNNGNEKE
jgi:hypothetical protein